MTVLQAESGTRMEQVSPHFRLAVEPERVKNWKGELITMRYCEELTAGRWEPFYSMK